MQSLQTNISGSNCNWLTICLLQPWLLSSQSNDVYWIIWRDTGQAHNETSGNLTMTNMVSHWNNKFSIQIAHCTQFEMEITDPSLVAPILLVLNNFITTNTPVISADQALLCALICNTIELIRYYTCVSWDLRVALEVYIFSIRYPPEHPKSRRHCTGFYINGLNNKDLLPKSS